MSQLHLFHNFPVQSAGRILRPTVWGTICLVSGSSGSPYNVEIMSVGPSVVNPKLTGFV